MKIGIVGAGVAGLAAAHDLVNERHQVDVYEAAPYAGGLASGFRASHWEWPLERFYHHVFEGDTAIRSLTNDIGYGDNLFFRKGVTAHLWNGSFYPIDSPVAVLRFPGIPFPDRVRLGMAVFYLKYVTKNWRNLERFTAAEWSEFWMGKPAYQTIVQPLLEGKFGEYARTVNLAWLWARFKARSFKLGYYAGGFQGFADALLDAVQKQGVTVHLQAPVQKLTMVYDDDTNAGSDALWTLHSRLGEQRYDRVIVTGSPQLLSKLAPELPTTYVGQLAHLKSLGAVVLVLALKKQLMQGKYWIQGMKKSEFPFLALVEHTNFIEPKYYGGDRLVYCGDYLPPEHDYFTMSKDEILDVFLSVLPKFNPSFTPDWVRDTWLFREPYAQPVVGLHHSKHIPPLTTPLRGLYWASMSQVYPWDRGTNYAVELGQSVAQEVRLS